MISEAKLQAAIDDLAFADNDPEAVIYDAAMEARAEVRRLRRLALAAKRVAFGGGGGWDMKDWARFHQAVRAYFYPKERTP